jgi:hypothetical protein
MCNDFSGLVSTFFSVDAFCIEASMPLLLQVKRAISRQHNITIMEARCKSFCCRVTASQFLLTSILRASNGPNLGPIVTGLCIAINSRTQHHLRPCTSCLDYKLLQLHFLNYEKGHFDNRLLLNVKALKATPFGTCLCRLNSVASIRSKISPEQPLPRSRNKAISSCYITALPTL